MEANEAAGKSFPHAGRCIAPSMWRNNRYLESTLVAPYEANVTMQRHVGMGLAEVYLLMYNLHAILTATVLQVVSGVGDDESWDDEHVDDLPNMFKLQMSLMATQLFIRFLRSPSKHTLLALKMNPSVDTSPNGTLFCDKGAQRDLMEGAYTKQCAPAASHLKTIPHLQRARPCRVVTDPNRLYRATRALHTPAHARLARTSTTTPLI